MFGNIELQNKAYLFLKNQILNNRLSFDEIYSATKMATEIDVSRTPMRDAVQRLTQEGLVEIVPNKGFKLVKITEEDILEAQEVRASIETFSLLKIMVNINSDNSKKLLIDLENCLKKQRQYKDLHDPDAFAEEDLYFHKRIVDSSNNTAFSQMFKKYVSQIKRLSIQAFKSKEDRLEQTYNEHLNIFNAMKSGDLALAMKVCLTHINATLSINMANIGTGDSQKYNLLNDDSIQ